MILKLKIDSYIIGPTELAAILHLKANPRKQLNEKIKQTLICV